MKNDSLRVWKRFIKDELRQRDELRYRERVKAYKQNKEENVEKEG